MKITHNDINKIIPYGDNLKGLLNQQYITSSEINDVLRERGVFACNTDKDYIVPLMQLFLLSPKEFDKIQDAFRTREDNKKITSSTIDFVPGATLFIPDIMATDVQDYITKSLPSCTLKSPISFKPTKDNNHLIADFTIERKDINKMWYEQTNEFSGSVEIVNENGAGKVTITYTASETRDIGAFVAKKQIDKFKSKKIISDKQNLKRILFNDFSNEERFKFFYQLSSLISSPYFTYYDTNNVSIKPEDDELLDEIKWMEKMRKIIIDGDALDKKFFMNESKYHKALILWEIEAAFNYDFNNEKGKVVFQMGFSDYISKKINAEFTLNIKSLTPSKPLDPKAKRQLGDKLRYEMDIIKSNAYSNLITD